MNEHDKQKFEDLIANFKTLKNENYVLQKQKEVAERALRNAVEFMEPYTSVAEDSPASIEKIYEIFLQEAEKELLEEGK